MRRVVSTLLVSLLAVFASASSAPVLQGDSSKEATPNFKEIGKTTYAKVFLDANNIIVGADNDGEAMLGGYVKIMLTEPKVRADGRKVASIVNYVVFSCVNNAAVVTRAETFDENGVSLQVSEQVKPSPWVKGSDSATNVLMTEICKDVKPKKP